MQHAGQSTALAVALVAGLSAAAHGQGMIHHFAGTAAGERFGSAVALIGDVDGDGVADVAVGATQANGNRGRVHVFSGGSGAQLWLVNGTVIGSRFGCSIAALGDVDGDGMADLAVGACLENVGPLPGAGRVYVLSGIDGSTIRMHSGGAAQDHFGWSVAGADANGDGVRDVIAGAPDDDDSGASSGSVSAYSGADGSFLFHVSGQVALEAFGISLSRVGDLNGDGREDFVAGAPGVPGSGLIGAARLLSGSNGALLLGLSGIGVSDEFGGAVAGAGDVDGDGTPDVVVGARQTASFGYARAFSSATGAMLFEAQGTALRTRYGTAVAGAGDIDYDGHADVLVGTPDARDNGSRSGLVQALSGADGSLIYELVGPLAGLQLGGALAGGVDVSGEGSPDFAVGAVGELNANAPTGGAFVYSGNDTPPPPPPDPVVPLTGTPDTISLATGGQQVLSMDAGPEFAGMRYVLLGSMSGTEPGFTMCGQHVPLNRDCYMHWALRRRNGIPLAGHHGVLDDQGRATATFTLPRRCRHRRLAGLTFHHAFIVLGEVRTPIFVSNAVSVTLVP